MQKINIENIDLIKTCSWCPEQYDAFIDGNQAAYLRLRHGYFSVECPDVFGQLVYEAEPNGDGSFDNDEREKYLSEAKQAIADFYNAKVI